MCRMQSTFFWVLFITTAFLLGSCHNPDGNSVMMQGGGVASLVAIEPTDGQASVPVNTSVRLFFNRAMDPTSLTTYSGSDPCGGSVSLSADGFSTCISLSGGADSTTDKSFTYRAIGPLANGTTYKVRVNTDAQSGSHHAMAQTWTSTQGFITVSAAGTTTTNPLSIASVTPASGAVDLDRNFIPVITFSENVDTATIGVQYTDGTCTGTFQFSVDNFVSCLATTNYSTSNGVTFTIAPVNPVPNYTQLNFRVKTSVKSSNGMPLDTEWNTTTPWGIVGWQHNDGGLTNGLNYGTSSSASNPVIRSGMSKLFVSWSEPYLSVQKVRVRALDLSTNTWSWADGGTTGGINQNGANSAVEPDLIEFNGNMYAAWSEHNGVMTQIRVKQFDGTSWTSIDGNNSYGINADINANAITPKLAVHNNQLFIAWSEYNTTSTTNLIRLAQWSGTVTASPTAPPWTFVDSMTPGLNYLNTKNAFNPVIGSTGSKLYLGWAEENGAFIQQTRFSEWNGSTSRNILDGNVADGLNVDPTLHARNPQIVASSPDVFLVWKESDGLGQIRMSQHDTYTLNNNNMDGGGTTGLNYDTTKAAYRPTITLGLGSLLVAWQEDNGTASQIRVISLSEFGQKPMDGDGTNGINVDSTKNASMANLTSIGGIGYIAWVEADGVGTNLLHVSKLP